MTFTVNDQPALEVVRVMEDSDRLRGLCPQCGADLISHCYQVGGRGTMIVWECRHSLTNPPTCTYKKVL